MMSKVYNKLVRDRIPEIIIAAGNEPVTRTAGDDEYEQLLKAKLAEEVDEFLTGDYPEELADILEVLKAAARAKGITWEQIEAMAVEKKAKRGGFEDKIVLVEVKG